MGHWSAWRRTLAAVATGAALLTGMGAVVPASATAAVQAARPGVASAPLASPSPCPSGFTCPPCPSTRAGSPGRSPSPCPSPSRTLPTPTDSVDPDRAVGGPQLASMGLVVDAPAGVPAPPAAKTMAFVIADADTGEVLAAKAPHARSLPASTVKALTALVLLPKLDPATIHVATQADAAADGTKVGLFPGQKYRVDQLMHAMVMASANDAAYALAAVNGGMAPTLAELNAKAAELGALDTHIGDPSGLDAPGQRTSAYDLALIGRAALRTPGYVKIATTREITFPGKPDKKTKKRKTYKVGNHNKMLWNYDGTIGVKNGYTNAAQRTYIGAVKRGGKSYLVTEVYSIEYGWRPTAALYDWTFRYADRLTPVGRLVDPGDVATASPSSTSAPAPPSPTATTLLTGASGSPARSTSTSAPVAAVGAISFTPASGVGTWAAGGAAALAALALLSLLARRRRRRTH